MGVTPEEPRFMRRSTTSTLALEAEEQALQIIQSGTINTAGGALNWSVDSNAAVRASCADQQLTITTTEQDDGSTDKRLLFSKDGSQPYLTIDGLEQGQSAVQLTLTAGASELTISIINIDRPVSTGTATISGSLAAARAASAETREVARLRAGQLDRAGRSQLQPSPEKFLARVAERRVRCRTRGRGVLRTIWGRALKGAQRTRPLTSGSSGGHASGHRPVTAESVIGWIGKGLAWAGAAVCGTAAVGGGVTPAGLVVVGVCGFGGYAGDQIAGWLDTDSVPVAPIVFVPPPEDEQTSTKSSTTWQDDPPPPQGQGQDPSSGQQNTPTETGPSGEGDAGGSGSGGSGDLPATTGQATVVVEAAAAEVRLRLAVEDDLAAARCDAHVCQQWVARADSQAQPVVRWRPLGQAFLWPPPTGGNRRGVNAIFLFPGELDAPDRTGATALGNQVPDERQWELLVQAWFTHCAGAPKRCSTQSSNSGRDPTRTAVLTSKGETQ